MFVGYVVYLKIHLLVYWGCCGRDRMVNGFTTIYAISAYHPLSCEFESCSWRGVLDTTLCDKVCQWLASGRLFSPSTTVSSTNKTDCHEITKILLKVVLNTIIHPIQQKRPQQLFSTYSFNSKFWQLIIC